MTELVTIDIQDHIADVRLNRPEKMNARAQPGHVEGHHGGGGTAQRES